MHNGNCWLARNCCIFIDARNCYIAIISRKNCYIAMNIRNCCIAMIQGNRFKIYWLTDPWHCGHLVYNQLCSPNSYNLINSFMWMPTCQTWVTGREVNVPCGVAEVTRWALLGAASASGAVMTCRTPVPCSAICWVWPDGSWCAVVACIAFTTDIGKTRPRAVAACKQISTLHSCPRMFLSCALLLVWYTWLAVDMRQYY